MAAIALYEIGFADRHIANQLAEVVAIEASDRQELVSALLTARSRIREALSAYPAYFSFVYANLIGSQEQAA
jgi:hypothetical protein